MISLNYELSYELGKIVENASYTKERLLEYRNEVRDILFNCTMLGDLQDVVLDYNDIPQEKDMAYCSNIEDSNIGLCLEIIKYNEIVRACHQYYSEIMEYVRMIREIKSYSFRHPIHSDYLVKFGSSKKNESLLICLLYKLEKGYELIETLDADEIYSKKKSKLQSLFQW